MKAKPKCRRCIPGNRCRIYVGNGKYLQVFCAICKNIMTDQELMRPRLALVAKP